MTQATELKKLLVEIFDDEIVEAKERAALAAFTKSMSPEETLKVFKAFLSEKWGEVIADDVITPGERRLLGHILHELHLRAEDLPPQARMALSSLL